MAINQKIKVIFAEIGMFLCSVYFALAAVWLTLTYYPLDKSVIKGTIVLVMLSFWCFGSLFIGGRPKILRSLTKQEKRKGE